MKKIFILLVGLSIFALSSCIFTVEKDYGKVYASFVYNDHGYIVRLQTEDPTLYESDANVIFNTGVCMDSESLGSTNCIRRTSNKYDLDVTDDAGKYLDVYELYEDTDGLVKKGQTFRLIMPDKVRGDDVHKTFTYDAKSGTSTFE